MVLSVQERRQLEQQDLYFLPRPLTLGPQPFSMAAHLRHAVRLFRDMGAPSPSSAVVAYLVGLYDRSVPPRTDIACRKGCDYCCCQPVLVSAPEAFFIAAQIREKAALRTAVAAAAQDVIGRSPDGPIKQWIRCPLLENQACAIYAARPLACHAFVSVKLEACLAAFVDHGPPDIPMPADNISLLYGCRMLLFAAQRLIGRPDHTYEMNQAVTVVLATDKAEARWLAGEDLFAGLENKTPIPPQFEREIAGMAAFVAPTL
jgi:hypothetical protein